MATTTTISDVSAIVFQNSAFWEALGAAHCNNVNRLPSLGLVLSVGRTMRSELLEVPAAVVCTKRKRAAHMIVNPRESIFNRAVRSMFAYDPDRAPSTTMSLPDAARRFAMSQLQVLAALCYAGKDPTAEGHAAARH